MNCNIPDKADIEQQLSILMQNTDALMLATVNEEGLPEASYAPYVEHDSCYYVFISELASHTTNLKRTGVASALFMVTDNDGHAHTRKRLTCHCNATMIKREDALFQSTIQLMEERFGNLITTLRGLGDFQLFQLAPVKGNFVAGFAQTFEVEFPLGGDIRHKSPG